MSTPLTDIITDQITPLVHRVLGKGDGKSSWALRANWNDSVTLLRWISDGKGMVQTEYRLTTRQEIEDNIWYNLEKRLFFIRDGMTPAAVDEAMARQALGQCDRHGGLVPVELLGSFDDGTLHVCKDCAGLQWPWRRPRTLSPPSGEPIIETQGKPKPGKPAGARW